MTQLELELQMCRTDFRFFVGYCFQHIYKTPFHFYKFHNELIDILLKMNETKRAIINAPPRIGKTELMKHFIAWQFIKNPSATVMYVSYDMALVARKNSEIQDILLWLAKRFGLNELNMKAKNDGKTEWTNNANGMIIARGSGNNITGSGCSTLLVIDDPNKPSDRTSPATLAKRNNIFMSTIRNRINSPDVPILVIQQRIAAEDLSGFLLAGGSNEHWFHANFPAINPDGTALCPERLPLTEIDTYKNDPFTLNAQFLQSPLEDVGNLFERHKLILSADRPAIKSLRCVISVDAALKTDVNSDYNAIAIIGTNGVDYFVLDVINMRADVTGLVQKIRELRKRYGPEVPVLFEAKANGVAAVQILRREMSGIMETSPTKDKIERALLVKYLFDSMNVKFTLRGFVWGEVQAQFTAFPHGRHDDIVDAVVQGITFLHKGAQKLNAVRTSSTVQLSRPKLGGTYGSPGYSPIGRF
jgi:predicted phage terminase large subunit-like protein